MKSSSCSICNRIRKAVIIAKPGAIGQPVRRAAAVRRSIICWLRARPQPWHRVDAVEIWHWYAGAPLQLDIAEDGQGGASFILGHDLATGQRPQGIVPPDAWQSARSLGAWTLVGCTVSPAFSFEGFEMAPTGWEPGAD